MFNRIGQTFLNDTIDSDVDVFIKVIEAFLGSQLDGQLRMLTTILRDQFRDGIIEAQVS